MGGARLEELTAYLAQVTHRTTVSQTAGISWPAGGSVVERMVARRRKPGRLVGLRRIVIDEFAYGKRHHYCERIVLGDGVPGRRTGRKALRARARRWCVSTGLGRTGRHRIRTGSLPGTRTRRSSKMKDGRTHLAHKAEHGVNLETGGNPVGDGAECLGGR